jgi:hypothetical protein
MRPGAAVKARCDDQAVDLFRRWARLGGRNAAVLMAYDKTPGIGDRPEFQALLAAMKAKSAATPPVRPR